MGVVWEYNEDWKGVEDGVMDASCLYCCLLVDVLEGVESEVR